MKELREVVSDFALAWKLVDADKPVGRTRTRTYSPGLGPLTEARAIELASVKLKSQDEYYLEGGPCQYPQGRSRCDYVIPNQWALEFKLARPFGDNGAEAEHWSENLLHPYPGNVSTIGDAHKLVRSSFEERLGIIVFGFEHEQAVIELETAVQCLELMLTAVAKITVSDRSQSTVEGLCQPYHQTLRVYGWEIRR